LLAEAPKIVNGPKNFSVTEEETITITCTYRGVPTPTFTWYQGETTIIPTDRFRVEFTAETVTLTIPKSVVEDTAEYTLRLENPVGVDTFKVEVTIISKYILLHQNLIIVI
jgi:hypothetical protein